MLIHYILLERKHNSPYKWRCLAKVMVQSSADVICSGLEEDAKDNLGYCLGDKSCIRYFKLKGKPRDASMQDNIKNEFESVNNGDALIEVAEQVDQYSTFSSIGIEDGVATNEVHLIVAVSRCGLDPTDVKAPDTQILFHTRVELFDQKWPGVVIRADKVAEITIEDLLPNQIHDSESDASATPEIVEALVNRLRGALRFNGTKVTVANLQSSAIYAPFSKSDSRDTIANSEDALDISWEVTAHLTLITAYGEAVAFKNMFVSERDMESMFFHFFSRFVSKRHPAMTCSSRGSWPISVIVKSGGEEPTYRRWTPLGDFSVSYYGIPRLVVEVCSDRYEIKDRHRMFVQGASVVRLVNHMLEGKTFILPSIYIHATVAHCCFLYEKDDKKVYYRKVRFDLCYVEQRLDFIRALYQLAEWIAEDAHDQVSSKHKLVRELVFLSKNLGGTFSSKQDNTKRREMDDAPPKDERDGSGDGAADPEFEVDGYEIIPGIITNESGTFETLNKLPPHVHRARRRGDPSKQEFIIKKSRSGSNELKILEYLGRIEPPCENIIRLVGTATSSTGLYIVLPRLRPVDFDLVSEEGGVLRGKLLRLGCDLTKGVSYLHKRKISHRDIKPDNLVYTIEFKLQIIDFDIAVQLTDIDEEIDDYCGSVGWMAPEIGEENGPRRPYSPILADKWSCGKVLALLADKHGRDDGGLATFARRLMDSDSRRRPSLLEWSEGSVALVPAKRRRVSETDEPSDNDSLYTVV